MGKTLTEKILAAHLVSGNIVPGEEIEIKIDQTLTQDATGTLAYLQFEAMELDRVKTELSVSYVDHNTQQADFKNMDDHKYLQSVAARYGIHFSRPGNGICHQVHLERFGIPGKTMVGSDSHTPTGGGIGMLAIGVGGLNVATAMAGAPMSLKTPAVIGVKLTGKLRPFCSAKDVILTLLKLETVKGGVGKVYEYFGEGVKSLSVPERATITNMGAELGATTSLFPSDEITLEFLKLMGREGVWSEQKGDENAAYSKVVEIKLDEVVPMAACPHMPDNVVPVSEIEGLKTDQVAIGSCTNSSINDLGIAADILGGKPIADNVSLGISPGSRTVFQGAIGAGIISKLVLSGARILEFACGPCIGMGFAPNTDAVSVRTFNRNFQARSGTKSANVYLVSPETAAATALFGKLTDPRKMKGVEKEDYSSFVKIDDSMIIPPPENGAGVEVIRGPNIKPCPIGKPLEDKISAPVLIKVGDNITTDHIMPAGAKVLPFRSNIPEISKFTFGVLDEDYYNRASAAESSLIVGGENYGQGSSREHAALAPMFLGVKGVITKGFARIHKTNLINFGILPLEFDNPGDYELVNQGDNITIEGIVAKLKAGEKLEARVGEKTILLKYILSPQDIEVLLAGGLLNYTRTRIG